MSPQETSPRPLVNPWIIAITVMLSTFLEVLDTSVVNVSLPHIAGSLSATIDEATWVLTSYLVANAIVLPITGWLANQFGRKRLLILAVAGFTTTSFLCGIAPTLPMLVLFRVLQGATGGALQPISQAILLETFPPQDRGKAMAFWGLGIVVAPILGPTLGGWLTDAYSWRWVFYINLPIGIASILMTKLVHLRSQIHPAPRRQGGFLGAGHAGGGHLGAADHARQGPGGRLVQLQLHHRPLRRGGGAAHRLRHLGAAGQGSDRASAASSRTAPTPPASS